MCRPAGWCGRSSCSRTDHKRARPPCGGLARPAPSLPPKSVAMQFGVFDHLDRCDGSLADFYADRLAIVDAYDRAGFYAYHLAEHHSTPLGMAPSPSVFLSAVAQRTRRLRFGPLVWAMPLHHPLRLIEEICMLDQLSGGRLELGFGRGSVAVELEYYGRRSGGGAGDLRRGGRARARRPDQQDARFPGQALHLQPGADGDRAAAEAASADLVRLACRGERRARGAPQPQRGEPRSAARRVRLSIARYRGIFGREGAFTPPPRPSPSSASARFIVVGPSEAEAMEACPPRLSALARELHLSVPAS